MKKLLFISAFTSLLFACGSESSENAGENASADSTAQTSMLFFGEKITADDAINAADLPAQLAGKDSINIKIKGSIEDVCQKKGCWMNVSVDDENSVFVKFKDYEFFVPKDAAGKTTIMEGVAYVDTTSVEELRHFAMDAGDPDSVINAITEPEIGYNFMAKGVIIE